MRKSKIYSSAVFGIMLLAFVSAMIVSDKTENEVKETVKEEVNTVEIVEAKESILVVEENVEEPQEENSNGGFKYLDEIPMSEDWQRYVWSICEEREVSPFLVYGMIQQESNFNPNAIGYDGQDIGLMQIRKMNHGWLNELAGRTLDYTNPYDNILAGVILIDSILEDNDGDITKSLMSYNMGPTGAKNAWSKGITSTEHTRKVEGYMQDWESVYNNCE